MTKTKPSSSTNLQDIISRRTGILMQTILLMNQLAQEKDVDIYYIDLFCGAGGTSTGVERSIIRGKKVAKVIACVNHDANAIASHMANHPDALHFTEDMRFLNLEPIQNLVRKIRMKNPKAIIVLWASLECTNFSKAKGGQPRDADSRTLADHLFRYINAIDPDYIQIENVREFMSWGDIDEKGKPISKDKGRLYMQWVEKVQYGYGKHADRMDPDIYEKWYREMIRIGSFKKKYDFDKRILNSADFGAYTSRERFFAQFAKPDLPIAWPEPTHCKEGRRDIFSDLKKWRAVKDVLDFSDEGESIFNRKKPLSPKTLERIYAGLIKFVAGGKSAFMLKYNSMNLSGKYKAPSIDEPCPTVSCQNRLAVANVHFISKQFSGHPGSKNIPISGPAHSITTVDHHALVGAEFLTKYYSGKPEHKCQSVNEPAGTVRTKDCFSLVQPDFLSAYYGTGDNVSSVDSPCPTVSTKDRFNYVRPKFLCSYNFNDAGKDINSPCPTLLTKDRLSVVSPRFLDMQYGASRGASVNEPAGTITGNPKHCLISCRPWIMNTNFNNIGGSVNEPSQVITANRKWHYLMNPQFTSAGGSIDNPCFTLIARMDKMPPYLVATETGEVAIQILSPESQILRDIKTFMAMYGIVDIKMRMLRIPELKRIMGFPEDYVLMGTQADQKKFIGNAVEVNTARVLCESMYLKLEESTRWAA